MNSLFMHSGFLAMIFLFTMRKKGVLQLALQFSFWIIEESCNSLYLYIVNANEQVAWIAKLQLTICIVQLIATQLQLYQNNTFSTIMQLYYNCTCDVILMSLIVIHLLKFDTWHYEFFWHKNNFFRNIHLHCSLWLWMMVQNCDRWHNKKLLHVILIIFWNK
jgi:hypothetical protein